MKILLLALCLISVSVVNLSAGEMRIWKAAEGTFQVEAALIQQSETHVKLKKKDGTELTVPRVKLSKVDLDYLLFADPPVPALVGNGKPAAVTKQVPEAKLIVAPPTDKPKPPAVKKPETSKVAGDTLETIRRSFNESFNAIGHPGKQQPLPAGPGTNYVELVNELTKPIALPTFVTQSKGEVRLTAAADKNWQETTCLAAGGMFLLEHDAAGEQLVVWSIETGKQAAVWKCGPLANARCYAISPTGKYLAAGHADGSVEVFEVATKKVARTVKLNAKQGNVYRVTFNWPEQNVFVLTESAQSMVFALNGGPDLGGSLLRYLPETLHTEQAPFKFDVKQNKIELAVAPGGRWGVHLNEKLHLSFDPATHPRQLLYKTTMPFHAVVPVRHGNFAWVSKIAIHKQVQIVPKMPGVQDEVIAERASETCDAAKHISVDRDERYVWACHPSKQSPYVEIVDVNYVKRPFRVMLPAPADGFSAENRLWVSAEQQSVVCWSPSSKQLTAYRLQDFAEPACWRLYSLVIPAFLEKRYEFLDGLFAELGKLSQPLPGSDRQLPLEEAIEFFSDRPMHVHPLNWQLRTEDWYKDRPESLGPRLVLANQVMDEGRAARGAGVAATVTPEGWEKFRKAGLIAEKLLEPIMSQPQPPAYAFVMQHTITKMIKRSAEAQVEIAKRASKLYPACAEFHAGMVFNLLPRWYGKQGDSVAYAEKISELLGGGEAGDIAYAQMGASLINLHNAEIFVAATEFDPKRVTRGLIKAAQRTPEDAQPYFLLMSWVYYSRFFNPDSEFVDHEMEEPLAKEYKNALNQFEQLILRNDWTIYNIPQLAASEYTIFKMNRKEPLRKEKIKVLPLAK